MQSSAQVNHFCSGESWAKLQSSPVFPRSPILCLTSLLPRMWWDEQGQLAPEEHPELSGHLPWRLPDAEGEKWAGLKRRHLEGIFQSRLPALLPPTQDWAGPPLTSPWRGGSEACCVSQSLPRFVPRLCRQALPPPLKDQRAEQRRSKTEQVSSGLAEVEGWGGQRWVSRRLSPTPGPSARLCAPWPSDHTERVRSRHQPTKMGELSEEKANLKLTTLSSITQRLTLLNQP